jgi:hypothetical protein
MTHGAHRFVAHRLNGEPVPRLLPGGLRATACTPHRATSWLTVGALEAKFFARLCELLDLPHLARAPVRDDQEAVAAELAGDRAAPARGVAGALSSRKTSRPARPRRSKAPGSSPAGHGDAPALGEHTGRLAQELVS